MAVWASGVWAAAVWANNVWFGMGGAVQAPVLQTGDWQIRYTKDHDKRRRKRWHEETLDRESLRAIIRAAVLGGVPAVAEFVEYEATTIRGKRPSDTSRVGEALAPSSAMPFIDYEAILGDTVALQNILSWHYKQQVELINLADDDDAIISLMM